MNLSDFDYTFPKDLVAQRPLQERDASRMMVADRAARAWRHSAVANLSDELRDGDLLIVNDSKVVPARLFGTRRNGERVEILLVEPDTRHETRDTRRETRDQQPEVRSQTPDTRHETRDTRPTTRNQTLETARVTGHESRVTGHETWRCLLKKAKNIRAGEQFFFGMQATAIARGRDGIFLLLEFAAGARERAIAHHGTPPLPPYIERKGFAAYTDEDRTRYQTVYATKAGSAAAPTAGLHFSEALLQRLRDRGIMIAPITLHVGIDTFAPVRAATIGEHRMHGERYEIPEETAHAVVQAQRDGRRVVAVGTTSVRALESAAIAESGHGLAAGCGVTNLFITPGFPFRVVDALLTNFHQPKSTLLILVSAFATSPGATELSGRDFILACYAQAIQERYRLFSYGDCMLIT